MKYTALIFLFSFFFSSVSFAETLENDSVAKTFHIEPVEYKINPKNLILPTSLLAAGIIATNTDCNKDVFNINRSNKSVNSTPFEDVLQYCVAPSLFIFDIFGEEKHHPIDQLFLMGLSYGFTLLPVHLIKENYESTRPDGGEHSFPSGHTAIAFVGAHLIYKEFKDSNAWIAYSGYAMASAVAAARLVNNKHWACDVLASAGIAILGTELAYLVYFPIRNWMADKLNEKWGKQTSITPIVSPEAVSVNFSLTF